jgi:hypothetical protein
MDDSETQGVLAKAIDDYLEIEDNARAEKAKTLGGIQTRAKALQAKVIARLARLDMTKAAFLESVKWHRHFRDGKSVFPKIDTGEDLDLVGGFSRMLLATGWAFKPMYDEATEKHMYELAEELMEEPIADDDKVVDIRDRETEAA